MTTQTTRTPAIEVRGLRKSFGKQLVLDGIDLEVPEGTVFALLGPNGAGKTTAIHILSTLISADAGEVRIAGFDVAREPDAVRGMIGLTGQLSAVDGQFTGEENLRLMADLNHLGKEEGRRRVAELLERFDLVDDAAKPAMTYSGGMRRRLDLAMTLVGDPRIIFLDEPTTGLDPRSRRVMWDIIRELVAGGVTIFLTTQYLEEADRLASGSRCSTAVAWSPRARRPSSSGSSPAAASGSSSVTRHRWTVPRAPSATVPATTRDSPSSSRTKAASTRCAPCSTSSTQRPSTSPGCPCSPRTWTTCSCPSPAATPATTPTRR